MKRLIQQVSSLDSFERILAEIERASGPHPPLGLSRASRLPVLAAIRQATGRPILLLTTRTTHALGLLEELALWLPDAPRLFFPEPSALFYENAAWSDQSRRERLHTLTLLAAELVPGAPRLNQPPVILAPARALMTRTLPRREFLKVTRTIKAGHRAEPLTLAQEFARCGYEAVNTVVTAGQFARRGGILDVWPQGGERPIRLDFFGDELESLREFDPASQRRDRPLDKVFLPPAREFLTPAHQPAPQPGQPWTEFHLPLLHEATASILDYLPRNTLILIDDWLALQDTISEFEAQALGLRQDAESEHSLPPNYPLPYLTLDDLQDELTRHTTLELGPAGAEEASDLAYAFTPGQRFGGQVQEAIDFFQRMNQRGDEITIVSRQAARLEELWRQSLDEDSPAPPVFISGSLAEGWLLSHAGGHQTHLYTDGEIFGWRSPQPRQRPHKQSTPPEAGYPDFQFGDLLVHVDYGIGRFQGLVKRTLDGADQEYLAIEYANGDQLYVPVHQADRLSRYIGGRGHAPIVSRLGGAEWQATKSRVKRAIEEVATDLLELYARRQVSPGFAFNPDTPWQHELEASFPYIETEDQLKVLAEVKRDMESPRPMDRLICGDVGYGKTEVALRAAFKAVMDGKQVAILVPTTILAQQHYRTFRQRLAAFPARVEMLSRFRTPAEQREVLLQLAQGQVDIIIGTHRLLQSDVNFKDLGLLIIDEEQRFGVTHKEYLKRLRTEVDVLTLTATPIPRTMYMALTGARDISTINTPPEERLPIATHVGPYSPRIVRQAVLRELERGGQVFFVHNRVQTIEGLRRQVAELVPEARIGVAHGQMPEKDLEQRMREFTLGELDVLLSTSIVESGLDIPNANTLIVDRADTFGLAQLYQLRGRVGRGAQRAYAYFFQHRVRGTTEEGRQRLETIAENTQLGAGFNIAMRDLEIRGAGDFLGTRQHGYIAAVGLNLYTRLLSQAVNEIREHGELQHEQIPQAIATYHPLINIDLALPSAIPDEYIPDRELRLRLYRRLADTRNLEQIEGLHTELADRFGPPPEQVLNLLLQLKVRSWAEAAGLASITVEDQQIILRFPTLPNGSPARALPPIAPPARLGRYAIWLPRNTPDWQEALLGLLNQLAEYRATKPIRAH